MCSCLAIAQHGGQMNRNGKTIAVLFSLFSTSACNEHDLESVTLITNTNSEKIQKKRRVQSQSRYLLTVSIRIC